MRATAVTGHGAAKINGNNHRKPSGELGRVKV